MTYPVDGFKPAYNNININNDSYPRTRREEAAPFTMRRNRVDAFAQDVTKAVKNVGTTLGRWTGLHEMSESGLRVALMRGAHINQTHGKGYTALHDAARAHFRPDSRVVELLLKSRDAYGHVADLTAVNDKGDTPLQTAVKRNNIQFLIAVLNEIKLNPTRPIDLDHRNNLGLDCRDQCRSNAARTLIASIADYKAPDVRAADFSPPSSEFDSSPGSTRRQTVSSLAQPIYENLRP